MGDSQNRFPEVLGFLFASLSIPTGYGSKLSHQGTAGFGRCFHLPGFHFVYLFLTHTQPNGGPNPLSRNSEIALEAGVLEGKTADLQSRSYVPRQIPKARNLSLFHPNLPYLADTTRQVGN